MLECNSCRSGVTRSRYFCLLLLVLAFVFTYTIYKSGSTLWDSYKLHVLESKWEGFGPEKGYYNYTVVTGLFDIGRGDWWTQGRTYNEYLGNLMEILMLDMNVVVFIEPKGIDFVRRIRKGRESRTKIYQKEIKDLFYAPLLPRIEEIMNSESFQENNENFRRQKPESTLPLYDMVTNSKVALVHEYLQDDTFKTDYIVWLDGGYGHGDHNLYPDDGIWLPWHLMAHPNQITFIAFEDLAARKSDAKDLHKVDTAWIAGGLFAGGKKAMEEFHRLHVATMAKYMKEGTIDDDQTTFLDCYYQNPSNFNPVPGDWYDLLKPFR